MTTSMNTDRGSDLPLNLGGGRSLGNAQHPASVLLETEADGFRTLHRQLLGLNDFNPLTVQKTLDQWSANASQHLFGMQEMVQMLHSLPDREGIMNLALSLMSPTCSMLQQLCAARFVLRFLMVRHPEASLSQRMFQRAYHKLLGALNLDTYAKLNDQAKRNPNSLLARHVAAQNTDSNNAKKLRQLLVTTVMRALAMLIAFPVDNFSELSLTSSFSTISKHQQYEELCHRVRGLSQVWLISSIRALPNVRSSFVHPLMDVVATVTQYGIPLLSHNTKTELQTRLLFFSALLPPLCSFSSFHSAENNAMLSDEVVSAATKLLNVLVEGPLLKEAARDAAYGFLSLSRRKNKSHRLTLEVITSLVLPVYLAVALLRIVPSAAVATHWSSVFATATAVASGYAESLPTDRHQHRTFSNLSRKRKAKHHDGVSKRVKSGERSTQDDSPLTTLEPMTCVEGAFSLWCFERWISGLNSFSGVSVTVDAIRNILIHRWAQCGVSSKENSSTAIMSSELIPLSHLNIRVVLASLSLLVNLFVLDAKATIRLLFELFANGSGGESTSLAILSIQILLSVFLLGTNSTNTLDDKSEFISASIPYWPLGTLGPLCAATSSPGRPASICSSSAAKLFMQNYTLVVTSESSKPSLLIPSGWQSKESPFSSRKEKQSLLSLFSELPLSLYGHFTMRNPSLRMLPNMTESSSRTVGHDEVPWSVLFVTGLRSVLSEARASALKLKYKAAKKIEHLAYNTFKETSRNYTSAHCSLVALLPNVIPSSSSRASLFASIFVSVATAEASESFEKSNFCSIIFSQVWPITLLAQADLECYRLLCKQASRAVLKGRGSPLLLTGLGLSGAIASLSNTEDTTERNTECDVSMAILASLCDSRLAVRIGALKLALLIPLLHERNSLNDGDDDIEGLPSAVEWLALLLRDKNWQGLSNLLAELVNDACTTTHAFLDHFISRELRNQLPQQSSLTSPYQLDTPLVRQMKPLLASSRLGSDLFASARAGGVWDDVLMDAIRNDGEAETNLLKTDSTSWCSLFVSERGMANESSVAVLLLIVGSLGDGFVERNRSGHDDRSKTFLSQLVLFATPLQFQKLTRNLWKALSAEVKLYSGKKREDPSSQKSTVNTEGRASCSFLDEWEGWRFAWISQLAVALFGLDDGKVESSYWMKQYGHITDTLKHVLTTYMLQTDLDIACIHSPWQKDKNSPGDVGDVQLKRRSGEKQREERNNRSKRRGMMISLILASFEALVQSPPAREHLTEAGLRFLMQVIFELSTLIREVLFQPRLTVMIPIRIVLLMISFAVTSRPARFSSSSASPTLQMLINQFLTLFNGLMRSTLFPLKPSVNTREEAEETSVELYLRSDLISCLVHMLQHVPPKDIPHSLMTVHSYLQCIVTRYHANVNQWPQPRSSPAWLVAHHIQALLCLVHATIGTEFSVPIINSAWSLLNEFASETLVCPSLRALASDLCSLHTPALHSLVKLLSLDPASARQPSPLFFCAPFFALLSMSMDDVTRCLPDLFWHLFPYTLLRLASKERRDTIEGAASKKEFTSTSRDEMMLCIPSDQSVIQFIAKLVSVRRGLASLVLPHSCSSPVSTCLELFLTLPPKNQEETDVEISELSQITCVLRDAVKLPHVLDQFSSKCPELLPRVTFIRCILVQLLLDRWSLHFSKLYQREMDLFNDIMSLLINRHASPTSVPASANSQLWSKLTCDQQYVASVKEYLLYEVVWGGDGKVINVPDKLKEEAAKCIITALERSCGQETSSVASTTRKPSPVDIRGKGIAESAWYHLTFMARWIKMLNQFVHEGICTTFTPLTSLTITHACILLLASNNLTERDMFADIQSLLPHVLLTVLDDHRPSLTTRSTGVLPRRLSSLKPLDVQSITNWTQHVVYKFASTSIASPRTIKTQNFIREVALMIPPHRRMVWVRRSMRDALHVLSSLLIICSIGDGFTSQRILNTSSAATAAVGKSKVSSLNLPSYLTNKKEDKDAHVYLAERVVSSLVLATTLCSIHLNVDWFPLINKRGTLPLFANASDVTHETPPLWFTKPHNSLVCWPEFMTLLLQCLAQLLLLGDDWSDVINKDETWNDPLRQLSMVMGESVSVCQVLFERDSRKPWYHLNTPESQTCLGNKAGFFAHVWWMAVIMLFSLSPIKTEAGARLLTHLFVTKHQLSHRNDRNVSRKHIGHQQSPVQRSVVTIPTVLLSILPQKPVRDVFRFLGEDLIAAVFLLDSTLTVCSDTRSHHSASVCSEMLQSVRTFADEFRSKEHPIAPCMDACVRILGALLYRSSSLGNKVKPSCMICSLVTHQETTMDVERQLTKSWMESIVRSIFIKAPTIATITLFCTIFSRSLSWFLGSTVHPSVRIHVVPAIMGMASSLSEICDEYAQQHEAYSSAPLRQLFAKNPLVYYPVVNQFLARNPSLESTLDHSFSTREIVQLVFELETTLDCLKESPRIKSSLCESIMDPSISLEQAFVECSLDEGDDDAM